MRRARLYPLNLGDTGAPPSAILPPPVPFSQPESCRQVRWTLFTSYSPPRRPRPPEATPAPSLVTSPSRMEQRRSPSCNPPPPRAPHLNRPSLIRRSESTDIGTRPHALPLGPTRQLPTPLALGLAGQPVFPPQSLTALARLSTLVHVRARA
jgi:hypothetical protein